MRWNRPLPDEKTRGTLQLGWLVGLLVAYSLGSQLGTTEGILGGRSPSPPTSLVSLAGEVRRSVIIEMSSDVDELRVGPERTEATAKVLLGRAPPRSAISPDHCGPIEPGPAGTRPVEAFALQVSDELPLPWNPERGRYEGVRRAELDLGWQPVTARSVGGEGWSLSLPGALQFGDRLVVQSVRLLSDGGWRVEWRGPYAPADVELQVEVGDQRWRCGVGGPTVELPWWLAERPSARVFLAATRTKTQLLPDHTAVFGRATLRFPVEVGEVRADQLDLPLPRIRDATRDRQGLPRSWWYHSGKRWRDRVPA
jgi:hypothetical protein